MTELKKIHFIGIGGIGISTLAQIYNEKGISISGSDIEDSDHITDMKKRGIKISIGHNENNLDKDTDLVIYSFAIEKDNPELIKAQSLNIPCKTYPQALGEFSQNYYTIGITGTHGKSTTTSMMALLALNAGIDPTIVDGTKMKELEDKNYRLGNSKYLIVEACEFRNAFLNYRLDVLAIINIDSDHLDFFKTQENYIKAFNEACKRVNKDGLIILDDDDKNSKNINEGAQAKTVYVTGKPENKNKENYYYLEGNTLYFAGTSLNLEPNVPGKFNIRNSAFAAIIGLHLGINNEKIEENIKKFEGSWRRMELKHTNLENKLFYDDYGHLPAEISNTLNAIRERHPDKKILAVFQPHQFIRIRNYLKEFGQSFKDADEVLIPDILRNRDTKEEIASINTPELIDEIKKNKAPVYHTSDMHDTADWIKNNQEKFDVIVAMGSGNIKKLYKML